MSNISIRSTRSLIPSIGAVAAIASALLVPSVASAYPAATALGELPAASAISAARGYVAVAVGDVGTRTLYVGHAGSIEPAKGVGELPDWAQPHLGIDAAQKTVVVYPRCSNDPEGCDLYAYEVLTGTERKLTAVNTADSELEGTIDHGTIAFTRSNAPAATKVDGQGRPLTRKLFLLRRSAKTPTLISGDGGEQLALSGSRLAQVRNTDLTAGICGRPTVELFNTSSRARTLVDSTVCGLDMASVASPALVGLSILWTWRSAGKGAFLFQRNLVTGDRSKAALKPSPRSYAATGLNSGYLLQYTGEGEQGGPTPLFKLSGITYKPAPKGH